MTPLFLIAIPHQMQARSLGWATSVDDLYQLAMGECPDSDRRKFEAEFRWAARLDNRRADGKTTEQEGVCLAMIGHDFSRLFTTECPRGEYHRLARIKGRVGEAFHQELRVLSILRSELRK